MPAKRDSTGSSISKLTVKELKERLLKRGLSTSGLKAELVSRLEETTKKDPEQPESMETEKAEETKQESSEITAETPSEDTPRRSTRIRKQPSFANSPTASPKASPRASPRNSPRNSPRGSPKPSPKSSPRNSPRREKKEEEPKKEPMIQEEKLSEEESEEPKKEAEKKEAEKKEVDAQHKKEATVAEQAKAKAPEAMEVEKKDEEAKRKSEESPKETQNEPSVKRRKWGATTTQSPVAVSTDTIHNILAEKKEKDTPKKVLTGPARTFKKALEANSSNPVISIPAEKKEPKPLPPETKVEQTNSSEPREVPPAKNPQSAILFVRHFIRPFTVKSVEDLMKETGTVVQFGMDDIRSKCFVVYETVEQAVKTREALHNLVWPPQNNSKLYVDFATEDDARVFFKKNRQPFKKAEDKKPEPPAPVKTLDDLFRKTETKPPLYYLPLSDEEVAKKKAAPATTAPSTESMENDEKTDITNGDAK